MVGGRRPVFLFVVLTALFFILHKSPTSHSIYLYTTTYPKRVYNTSKMPQQQRFQKIASTMPLPTAEPLQAQCQSVSICIDACGRTDLLQNLRHQQRMPRAEWMIINNEVGSVPDLRHLPLGQGHHHQSDWFWPAELVLAGQQLAVVEAADLADPYTDYMVAVAEIDTLEGVHYSQVGMAQVDHHYTARERLPGTHPGFH